MNYSCPALTSQTHYLTVFSAWPWDRMFGILKEVVRGPFMWDLKDISWPTFWVIHFLLHSLHFYSPALFSPSTPSLYTTSPPVHSLMASPQTWFPSPLSLFSLSLSRFLSFPPSYLASSGSRGHPEFCRMLRAALHSVKSAIVCRTHRNLSPTGDAHASKKDFFCDLWAVVRSRYTVGCRVSKACAPRAKKILICVLVYWQMW